VNYEAKIARAIRVFRIAPMRRAHDG
jgi:hypothetical protein